MWTIPLPLPHLLNLAAHIGAGVAAIGLGLVLLAGATGTAGHRRRGRLFAAPTLAVCVTGIIGNVLFRFIPLFAVLTVLVTYQLLSGWHAVYTRAAGPDRIDVFRVGQPWSQLLPSVLGMLAIGFFIWRALRVRRRNGMPAGAFQEAPLAKPLGASR